MKVSSKHVFLLKIMTVLLLSLLAGWLVVKGLYFSSILLLLVIIVVSFSIYHDRIKLIERMERMIAGIRNADFSFRFAEKRPNDELYTLSKEMEEALIIFRNRMHSSFRDEAESEAWQKLISVLTHEIMNSISPIISLSDTLSEENNDQEIDEEDYRIMKQAMQAIHRRSNGLLTFVENYRKLTRLPEPTLRPIYLQPFFQSLQQLEASNSIYFTYSIYPEQLFLMADKDMLEQLLINLLKNAKEACSIVEEPCIMLKAMKVGEEIQIIVSDNGSGISPSAIDKIFIPFYTTKNNGSGIGLSLSKQIMTRHKGKISVQSDERGTKFVLHFS